MLLAPTTSTSTELLITQLENQINLTTISTWLDSHSSTWSLTDDALVGNVYGTRSQEGSEYSQPCRPLRICGSSVIIPLHIIAPRFPILVIDIKKVLRRIFSMRKYRRVAIYFTEEILGIIQGE